MHGMDLSSIASSSLASSSNSGDTATAVGLLVLRKAIDIQAAGAIALLNALPPQPALATEGSLGRHLNTFA